MTSVEDRLPARYWRLWWAGAIGDVGNGAFVTAVPLLAVALTPDARLISVVTAASFVPWLLFSLPVGALVDRFDRLRLMRGAQLFQAIVVAAAAVLVTHGALEIAGLVAAAFAIGVGQVVFGIASQSILPEIVSARQLSRANARQYMATTIGQSFLGPPAGSLLFGLAIALPFGLDAAALVTAALLLTTVRATPPRSRGRLRPGPRSREAMNPPRSSIMEGLRWLVRHPLLHPLALLLAVNTFCFQLGNVTLVLLATRELGATPTSYGFLLAMAAVGSVLGGLLTPRLTSAFGQMPVLIAALAVNAVAFVLLGLSPDPWTLAALLAISGLVTAIWNVITVTLRQELVPRSLLGRVNSAYRLLGWGLIPLGALAGGFIAHEIGIRAAYPGAGALRALALAITLPLLLRAHRLGRE